MLWRGKTTIARREGPDEWRQVYQEKDGVEVKLFAIDGYGEDDIYVTGIGRRRQTARHSSFRWEEDNTAASSCGP